jgi:hypothetical protein
MPIGINHFAHIAEYFEYLLGDLDYMGKEILSCNGLVATNGVWIHTQASTMKAYNKIHVGYRVKVE